MGYSSNVGGSGATAFLGLTDSPSAYAGGGLDLVRVNAGETALEFVTASAGATTFIGLTDTPGSFATPSTLYRVNAAGNAVEEADWLIDASGHLYPAADVTQNLGVGTTNAIDTIYVATVQLNSTGDSWTPTTFNLRGIFSIIPSNNNLGRARFDTSVAGTPQNAMKCGAFFGATAQPIPRTWLNSNLKGGFIAVNEQAATVGNQEYSAPVAWQSNGWKTDATAESQSVWFYSVVRPVQGAAAPTGGLHFSSSVDAANDTDLFAIHTGGHVSFDAGLNIAGLPTPAADGALAYTTDGGFYAYHGSAWAALATAFTGLSDTPASYSGEGTKLVRVNSGATALEFVSAPAAGATTFVGLTDTPGSFTTPSALYRVNAAGNAVEESEWVIDGTGELVPDANNTRDIGTASKGIKNLYVESSILLGDGSTITISAWTVADNRFTWSGAGNTADTEIYREGIMIQSAAVATSQATARAAYDAYYGSILLDQRAAATSGNQEYSGAIGLRGSGWKTDATAAAQDVEFWLQVRPVQGAAAPTGGLWITSEVNAGGASGVELFSLHNSGIFTFEVANSEASLPADATVGSLAYFSDGDAGAACMAWYDGTNWRVFATTTDTIVAGIG